MFFGSVFFFFLIKKKNSGSMLFDIGLSNTFIGYVSSDKGNKSKNKQMGFIKLKSFVQQSNL